MQIAPNEDKASSLSFCDTKWNAVMFLNKDDGFSKPLN